MTLICRKPNSWLEPFEMFAKWDSEFGNLFRPAVDLTETDQHYLVKADLPGMKKEDIEISITGNQLTIRGERKDEHEKTDKNYHVYERRQGSFERIVEFPDDVNPSQVKASYRDGVLEIEVAKSDNIRPKQIKIEVK